MYFILGLTVLIYATLVQANEREKIKRVTMEARRRLHRHAMAA
jgi:hypothetical protein